MIDFDKIIAAALAEGTSEHDIAEQFATAMNKNSNAKRDREPTPEEKYIREVKGRADKAVASKQINLGDAFDILCSCVYTLRSDWSLDALKMFATTTRNSINMNIRACDRLSEQGEFNLLDLLSAMLEDKDEKCDCGSDRGCAANKSKDDGGRSSHRSDEEVLVNFFKSLGL